MKNKKKNVVIRQHVSKDIVPALLVHSVRVFADVITSVILVTRLDTDILKSIYRKCIYMNHGNTDYFW